MFKYVWMSIIGVIYLAWGIASIKNVFLEIKEWIDSDGRYPLFVAIESIDDWAAAFFAFTIATIFVASLITWLAS